MRTRTTFPVALACAAALTAACSPKPSTEKELEQLRSFGPGLQRMGEGIAEAGEAIGDGMCRLGRGFARGEQRKEYARHCPAPRRRRASDGGRGRPR